MLKPVLLLITSLIVLPSCETLQRDFEERTCNYDGAYEAGSNDGQAGKPMNGEGLATQCPEASRGAVRKGYREGYALSKTSNTNISISIGNNSAPLKKCISSFGKQYCGYDCKEAYGRARCSQVVGHNCLEAYGAIQCGQNCREEYGKIECDEYE